MALGYPDPAYPAYAHDPRPASVEELLPIARHRTTKRYGFPALSGGPKMASDTSRIAEGERLLIVTHITQDELVLEAMKVALKEVGAAQVDHINVSDLTGDEPTEYSAADGWREIPDRLVPMVEKGVTFTAIAHSLRDFLRDRPDAYDSYYVGQEGGAVHWHRAAGGTMRGQWLFTTYQSLASRGYSLPDELWRLIDLKVLERFTVADAVHITDPQGTDISWEVTPEQAALWPKGAYIPGHILGSTIQGIRFGHTVDDFIKQARILFPTLEGVVAGTANHTGYFPHIKVSIEGGLIQSIEGGGRYGELWNDVLERFSHAEYPGFPQRGWGFFNDASIGTNPKAYRHSDGLWSYGEPTTNLPERLRAGVLHFGFGAEHWDETFLTYARENHFPTMHFPHVHIYFPTYGIRNRDTGEWEKLIDKGWLTVLDDPEVRRLAGIFGDPDEVLSYDWVPNIPGVNSPGEYQRDFGDDPVKVISREVTGDIWRAAR
ncbi:MAG: hypothetical protein GEU78_10595 [Actinobacteria bacterium]|nr:hypothetical protein [Actinomycetota bacterium]